MADMVNYSQSAFAQALCFQAQLRPQRASETIEKLIGYALETHNGELLTVSQAFQAELSLGHGNISRACMWAVT